jgi:hypothetical protein
VASDDLAEVASELDGIAERLADLALDRLRSAVDPDDPEAGRAAAEEERRITRARRSVEKAAVLLDQAARSQADADAD